MKKDTKPNAGSQPLLKELLDCLSCTGRCEAPCSGGSMSRIIPLTERSLQRELFAKLSRAGPSFVPQSGTSADKRPGRPTRIPALRGPLVRCQPVCIIPRMLLTELLHARLMRDITSAIMWKTHKVKNPPAT